MRHPDSRKHGSQSGPTVSGQKLRDRVPWVSPSVSGLRVPALLVSFYSRISPSGETLSSSASLCPPAGRGQGPHAGNCTKIMGNGGQQSPERHLGAITKEGRRGAGPAEMTCPHFLCKTQLTVSPAPQGSGWSRQQCP